MSTGRNQYSLLALVCTLAAFHALLMLNVFAHSDGALCHFGWPFCVLQEFRTTRGVIDVHEINFWALLGNLCVVIYVPMAVFAACQRYSFRKIRVRKL